ncbi:hypothetical protein CHLRE_11g467638v5 [Chlamydomonas reinhardtii]|uniref:Leucine-rich repeat-containing N-terminal plant-type domain-containing protein n=1 Tax=Chlamydomonas reinhardtii TaxID=3055 RepID=A0A2K3D7J2_CHLRE|nr:uncharacterized protein CHLRE_11g467638v5 [Chlamydomonas reinhardtii]PNW76496.1 hypothetical protein CHLRE_11g467638v5 [Chlamydomonas reinhardtii]
MITRGMSWACRAAAAVLLPLLLPALLPPGLAGAGAGVGIRVAEAKTLERDVFGLIALHQEVRDRSPEWRGAMDKWPVHTCDINGTCAVDPCGNEWDHGWEAISCRYQQNWPADIPRVVTNIHLPKRSLIGAPPRSVVLLANLTELDMDTNELTGPLPTDWACLRNLIEIDFSNNRLSGTIPPQWGLLDELVEMEFDGNPGVRGCLPRGVPPRERLCGGLFGSIPCPTFTTDRMIGTATTGSQLTGQFCPPYPGGDTALAATLSCPVVADFRRLIVGFFDQLAAEQAAAQADPGAPAQTGSPGVAVAQGAGREGAVVPPGLLGGALQRVAAAQGASEPGAVGGGVPKR